MGWYRVVKTVKGHRYLYDQRSWREGKKVRTESRYIGPAGGDTNTQVTYQSASQRASQLGSTNLEPRQAIRKLRPFLNRWIGGGEHDTIQTLAHKNAHLLERFKPQKELLVYRGAIEIPVDGTISTDKLTGWTIDINEARSYSREVGKPRYVIATRVQPEDILFSLPEMEKYARVDKLGQSEVVLKPGSYSVKLNPQFGEWLTIPQSAVNNP